MPARFDTVECQTVSLTLEISLPLNFDASPAIG